MTTTTDFVYFSVRRISPSPFGGQRRYQMALLLLPREAAPLTLQEPSRRRPRELLPALVALTRVAVAVH